MPINFKLNFGSHKVEVVFNEAANAKWQAVTQGWESADYGNAITALMTGYYPVQEFGLYMHMSFEELRLGFKNDNAGYAFGFKLRELIESKAVSYRKAEEIEDFEIYRIRYDGLFAVFASHVPYVDAVEGEPDFVRHNRNAIIMVKNLARLQKVQDSGWNLRLVYTDEELGYFTNPETGLMKKYELVLAGKLDEVKAILNAQINGQKAYRTIAREERREKKAAEEGTPVERKASNGKWVPMSITNQELVLSDLIGQSIQIVTGALTQNRVWLITETETDRKAGKLSVGALEASLRTSGSKVAIVGESEAPKARRTRAARKNEPVSVE